MTDKSFLIKAIEDNKLTSFDLETYLTSTKRWDCIHKSDEFNFWKCQENEIRVGLNSDAPDFAWYFALTITKLSLAENRFIFLVLQDVISYKEIA